MLVRFSKLETYYVEGNGSWMTEDHSGDATNSIVFCVSRGIGGKKPLQLIQDCAVLTMQSKKSGLDKYGDRF